MEGNAFTSIDIGYLDVGLIGDTTAEGISLVPPWGSELSIQSLVLTEYKSVFPVSQQGLLRKCQIEEFIVYI